ncbi:MAG: hypothetical protein LQ343_001846 [Gyalolechia ehrenbergii]|nr:MAG: hypothetical protein LQ343_001846 [Gyalolechia ehrenbergii]
MVDVLSECKFSSDKAKLSGESLRDFLDILLERYLHLLHQYQLLQQKMAKEMSSGYFSLAQANFSNANRIHYGQDSYDDRMQASTRLNVNARAEETSGSEPLEHVSQDTFSVSTLLPTNGQPTGKQTEGNGDCAPTEKHIESAAPISDPLRWFGILVPPALRASQNEALGYRDPKDTQEDQKSMLIEDKQTLSTNISIPYGASEMYFAV